MRAFHEEMTSTQLPRRLKLLVVVAVLVLGLTAVPASLSLYGKDKDKDKDKTESEQKVKDKDQEKDTEAEPESGKNKPEKERKSKEKEKDKEKHYDKGKEKEKDKEKVKEKRREKEKEKDKGKENAKEKDAGAVDENDASAKAQKEEEAARLAAAEAECRKRLAPVIDMVCASRDSVQKLGGYSCTFIKQEQVNKKGAPTRQAMTLKFRREPFSVYIKYLDPHAGREVIYADGRYKGKLQVHEPSGLASFVGTISLSPTGSEALKESRYPVTMIGMEKMLDTLIAEWDEAAKDAATQVQFYPQAKLGELECIAVEVKHVKPYESCKAHYQRIYFDKKMNLPVRCERYGFPAKSGEESPLIEEYTYLDVRPEAALADCDFDVNNEKYGFK